MIGRTKVHHRHRTEDAVAGQESRSWRLAALDPWLTLLILGRFAVGHDCADAEA